MAAAASTCCARFFLLTSALIIARSTAAVLSLSSQKAIGMLKISVNEKAQSLIDKVDSRIEQHMKNLGYKSSKKSLQFKQLRNQFIELWYLRHELKQELLALISDTLTISSIKEHLCVLLQLIPDD